MKYPHYCIIGIAGGSGSGKTSFLKELMNHFTPEQVALVSQDNYYQPKHLQHVDENGMVNYDLPTSIDREAFHRDMMKLQSGESLTKLEYNFNNPNWKPKEVIVQSAPVIIMEGLFIFHFDEIRKALSKKVYIDVHHDERLARRIKRDAIERGYPEHEVRYQWQNHVRPAEEKYLDPYLPDCDLVVDNSVHYTEGLESLVAFINSKLKTDL